MKKVGEKKQAGCGASCLFLYQGTGAVIFLCNILFHGIIENRAFRPPERSFLLHNPCNIGQKLWTERLSNSDGEPSLKN